MQCDRKTTVTNCQQTIDTVYFAAVNDSLLYIYVLSAFKDFNTADIEDVRLKFGIKLGGTGIPYITESSAESNLEIEVKCKFPEKQKPDSQ